MEGFKLLKAGMSVQQALTQPTDHLFPYPGVSNKSGRSWRDIFPRARLVDEDGRGRVARVRSLRATTSGPPGRFAMSDGASEPH